MPAFSANAFWVGIGVGAGAGGGYGGGGATGASGTTGGSGSGGGGGGGGGAIGGGGEAIYWSARQKNDTLLSKASYSARMQCKRFVKSFPAAPVG